MGWRQMQGIILGCKFALIRCFFQYYREDTKLSQYVSIIGGSKKHIRELKDEFQGLHV